MLTKMCTSVFLVALLGVASPAIAQPAGYDTTTTTETDDGDNSGLWGLLGLLGGFGLLGLRRRSEAERMRTTHTTTPATSTR